MSLSLYRSGSHEIQSIVSVFWSAVAIFLVTINTIEVDFFPYFIAVFWMLMGVIVGLYWRAEQELLAKPEDSVLRRTRRHA